MKYFDRWINLLLFPVFTNCSIVPPLNSVFYYSDKENWGKVKRSCPWDSDWQNNNIIRNIFQNNDGQQMQIWVPHLHLRRSALRQSPHLSPVTYCQKELHSRCLERCQIPLWYIWYPNILYLEKIKNMVPFIHSS